MTEPPRPPSESFDSAPQDPQVPPPPPAAPPPPPPNYPPAPPPNYPPAGGYPPPGYGAAAPVGYANSDEKTWALIAHFGGALTGFIAPLIVFLVKGNESQTTRAHSVAALNFQITWSVISFVSVILATCLIFLIIPIVLYLVPLVQVVFGIVAGLKANEGQLYNYPMTVQLVK